jgi:hypothetical protein
VIRIGASLQEAEDAAADAMTDVFNRWSKLRDPLGYERAFASGPVSSSWMVAAQRAVQGIGSAGRKIGSRCRWPGVPASVELERQTAQ